MQAIPIIPNNITVHLGSPDSPAENVNVPFIYYIKNVVSSEIYPTWDYDAIVANTLAIVSFALNRIYTEFYPSRGKDFDITNSTAIDQKFVRDRSIFDNVGAIVDNYFDVYIRRKGFIEPLAAKFCNGTTVTCAGLSQWGSEYMARDGVNYLNILYAYYGNDIELVYNAPVKDIKYSYAGALKEGNSGLAVRNAQIMLNRISEAYPSIPKIAADGIFGPKTGASVKKFQQIFGLTSDGIIGKATWYELVRLYVGLNRLNELNSLGQQYYGISLTYPAAVRFGDRGNNVRTIQYFINVIAEYSDYINSVPIDGIFGNKTLNAVKEFQSANGLPVDGLVGRQTWDLMYNAVKGIYNTDYINLDYSIESTQPFPGKTLIFGDSGEDVSYVQKLLNGIFRIFRTALPINVNGYYDNSTVQSVNRFQLAYELPITGTVDEQTWNALNQQYLNAIADSAGYYGQGFAEPLSIGDADN